MTRWSPKVKLTLAGALSVLTIAGAALADPKPVTRYLKPELIDVNARPLSGFDRAHREKTDFGQLQWRGGLVLSASLAAFGGFSGLIVDGDGKTFVSVSDAGAWMTGALTYDGKGRLDGVKDVRLGPITALGGKSLTGGRSRDAEAVTLASGSIKDGQLLISFEQKNRIGRFGISKDGLAPPSGYLTMPPEFKNKRGTDGIEAVTVMRSGPLKGATLAIAEAVKTKDGHHAGWIWTGKEPKAFGLTDIEGFNVTDIAGLPEGDVLVLERRFRWTEGVRVRIRRIAAAEVRPGAVIAGEVIFEADLNQEIDNLEGLAVHTNADGEAILTMISDDNFNRFLQRTILLQFALTGSGPKQAGR